MAPSDTESDATRRRDDLLQSLQEMAESDAGSDAVIEAAADGLRDVTGLDHVLVIVRDDESALVVRHASVAAWELQQLRDHAGLELQGMHLSADVAAMLSQLEHLGSMMEIDGMADVIEVVRALAPDERIANMAEDAVRSQSIGYGCVAPLIPGGEPLGAIVGSSYGRQKPREEELELIRAVADLLASALGAE